MATQIPPREGTPPLGEKGASSESSKRVPPSKYGQGLLLAPLKKGRDEERLKFGLPWTTHYTHMDMVWVVRIQSDDVFRYSFNKHVPSSSCVPSLHACLMSPGPWHNPRDLPSRTLGCSFSVSVINPSHQSLSVGPWTAHRPGTPGGKDACPLLQMREARWPLGD